MKSDVVKRLMLVNRGEIQVGRTRVEYCYQSSKIAGDSREKTYRNLLSFFPIYFLVSHCLILSRATEIRAVQTRSLLLAILKSNFAHEPNFDPFAVFIALLY